MVKFPHDITIKRITNDPYSASREEDIWSGKCCFQVHGKSTYVSDVVSSDYEAYIPDIDVEIKVGDMVEAVTKTGWTPTKGIIKQLEISELGLTLWIDEHKN